MFVNCVEVFDHQKKIIFVLAAYNLFIIYKLKISVAGINKMSVKNKAETPWLLRN